MTLYETYFDDADEPWFPKLIDIEYAKNQTEDPKKAEYYSQFGWSALDYGDAPTEEADATYPHIYARWDTLEQRFNQKYGYRMVSIETLEHWQNNLQTRFDEVADRYERAYSLYETYNDQMLDDVIEGEQETIHETNQASGTDTVEYNGSEALATTGTDSSTHSEWDTPDSAINANASYADRRATDGMTHGKTDTHTFTNRADDTTYGRKDTHDIERVRIITGKGILDNVNASIRDWRDIDTAFIAEFEPLFLNVLWY